MSSLKANWLTPPQIPYLTRLTPKYVMMLDLYWHKKDNYEICKGCKVGYPFRLTFVSDLSQCPEHLKSTSRQVINFDQQPSSICKNNAAFIILSPAEPVSAVLCPRVKWEEFAPSMAILVSAWVYQLKMYGHQRCYCITYILLFSRTNAPTSRWNYVCVELDCCQLSVQRWIPNLERGGIV